MSACVIFRVLSVSLLLALLVLCWRGCSIAVVCVVVVHIADGSLTVVSGACVDVVGVYVAIRGPATVYIVCADVADNVVRVVYITALCTCRWWRYGLCCIVRMCCCRCVFMTLSLL